MYMWTCKIKGFGLVHMWIHALVSMHIHTHTFMCTSKLFWSLQTTGFLFHRD